MTSKENPRQILTRIEGMVTGKAGDRVAPHKPLYLLQCIAGLQKGLPRLRAFSDIRKELAEALRLFTNAKQSHPEYPFFRLCNDGLAELVSDDAMSARESNNDPKVSELINKGAKGGLLIEDFEFLKENPRAQGSVVVFLLNRFFPPGVHGELLNYFGITLFPGSEGEREAELRFRENVLAAYQFRCAFSGYSIYFSSHAVCVDAVRICWTRNFCDSDVTNGLAMSPFFARLFDLGLIAINKDYRVMVSRGVENNPDSYGVLASLVGSKIHLPDRKSDLPDPEKLLWHQKWVFKDSSDVMGC